MVGFTKRDKWSAKTKSCSNRTASTISVLLKDFPEIHFKLLEEADWKQKATQGDLEVLQNKKETSKVVIKMFNELA